MAKMTQTEAPKHSEECDEPAVTYSVTLEKPIPSGNHTWICRYRILRNGILPATGGTVAASVHSVDPVGSIRCAMDAAKEAVVLHMMAEVQSELDHRQL
jgi:hypothetical protein